MVRRLVGLDQLGAALGGRGGDAGLQLFAPFVQRLDPLGHGIAHRHHGIEREQYRERRQASQQRSEIGGGHAEQCAGGGRGFHILMPRHQISKLIIWAMMNAPMPIQHMPPMPMTCIVLSPKIPAGSGVKKGFIYSKLM